MRFITTGIPNYYFDIDASNKKVTTGVVFYS